MAAPRYPWLPPLNRPRKLIASPPEEQRRGDMIFRLMGKALRDGYRRKVFLMTKVDGRTKQTASQQIDDSLRRLQTEHIDLLQHHEVIRLDDPDRIFTDGGAQEAVLEARKAGKIRYIGFTGHKDPLVHLRMLQIASDHGFHFDSVQMPLNVMDAHFRSFQHQDDNVKALPRVKRQQHSHWHDGSGNGRQQSFGLIRRVISILAFGANSMLCCERVHQITRKNSPQIAWKIQRNRLYRQSRGRRR
jgi:hypothetical protein